MSDTNTPTPGDRRDRVEVYVDTAGDHRWRYLASNGHILADSGQGYSRRADAVNGLSAVLGDSPVWDLAEADGTQKGRVLNRRLDVVIIP